jgi:phosphoribosylaminoimidazole carboxylase PurE protein
MSKPLVSIVMGSDSDLEIMREAGEALDEFGIAYEIDVTSAHRSPDRTADFARKARERGILVIIAGAGGAAHLAGVIAAHTTLPVIGVPIPSTSLQGMDSLLATVQMPAGIPVATVAIGKPGATNAGILAAQMIALSDASIAKKLEAHKEKLALRAGSVAQNATRMGHPAGSPIYSFKLFKYSRNSSPKPSRLSANSTVAFRNPSLSPASWRRPS